MDRVYYLPEMSHFQPKGLYSLFLLLGIPRKDLQDNTKIY